MTDIAELRASLAKAGPLEKHPRVALGHGEADACLNGGLARGALHEVFAVPGHEAAAAGFATALGALLCGGKHLLWIRQDFSAGEQGDLAATGFLEFGFDPSRLLLLRAPDVAGALRAASYGIGSAALGAVVLELNGNPKLLDLVALRRLALGAAESGVGALLLRFGAVPEASPAETRWLVCAASSLEEENWGRPVFDAALVRNRHGAGGHWVLEWSCDDGLFKEQAADRGAVVPALSHRPVAAALESKGAGLRAVA
jgi:protein ImuA